MSYNVVFTNITKIYKIKKYMKGLVISGGGALGAWGGGVAEALSKDKDYKVFVGTSTGSLLTPLVATKQFGKLKEAYTSVNQKSIFKFNPMKKNGDISILKVLWRMLLGKKTIGDSANLRKLIDEFVTEKDYAAINQQQKEVAVCCANLNKNDVGYFSTQDCTHYDFKDWMWISANAPVYMSLVNKGDFWVDGGIIDHTPIQYAIDAGCTEIDVIVHKVKEDADENLLNWKPKNIIQLFLRVIDFLLHNVYRDDINVARLEADSKDITLNIYHMPEKFLPHFLLFDKEKMLQMWDRGYNDTMNDLQKVQSVVLKANKK
jgi:predicted acylesterase/phospholipase RssA